MRKLLIALLILCSPAFAMAEVSSIDNGYSEKINSYSVDATLNNDASIDVVEKIVYDFGNNEKHGVYRYIPVVYEGRMGNPRQTLNIFSVTDNQDNPLSYSKGNSGNSDFIQIGDPDILVSGVQVYKISYRLTHMISSDSDGDRFRWDAIGTGWNVPINNILITLKEETNNRASTTHCYLGSVGSEETCEYTDEDGNIQVAIEYITASSGVTIDMLFGRGTYPGPGRVELLLWETTWYYWLPLIGFLGFFMLWFEKGRDPRGRGTIVPIYDPEKGMNPYEATIILDDMISKKALPAAIISLATRGYIKIHRKEVKVLFVNKTEYELEMVRTLPVDGSPIESKVMDLFFTGRTTVNLKDLGDSFQQLNMSLHNTAYKEVTEKGYFVVNPNISRIIFFASAVAVFIFGIVCAIYFLVGPLGFVSFSLPGVIGFIFAFFMPVKTKEGVLAKENLLGLKMYIKTAEIDRIKFHNAPAKNPEKFEELLPYAIIFGLEQEWAEEFKDVYKNAPDWYDGNMATFSVIALTHDLGSFSNAAVSAAVSSASSSSGGFGGVGGGGGGGGGGSW